MKSFTVLALAASASLISAAPTALPVVKRDSECTNNDTTILQIALTLENLESAFYEEALDKFDADAFAGAGYPPFVRNRYKQIHEHEQKHVALLQGLLGPQAVKSCTYSFPYNDVKSFIALSEALEDVGQAAYQGAAPNVQDPSTLAIAASILTTESKHGAWIGSAVQHVEGWSGPLGNNLTPKAAFSLASQFIESCPPTNVDLGIAPFPKLSFEPSVPLPGSQVTIKYDGSNNDTSSFFVASMDSQGTTNFALIPEDNTIVISSDLQGTVYFYLVSDDTAITDENTVAGPTQVIFPFGSDVSNVV